MKFIRLKNLIFLHLAHLPMSRTLRARFCKWGGVNILYPSHTLIGENVMFDTNHPELIVIEKGIRVTLGCIILAHFKNSNTGQYTFDKVLIKENAFIGCNSVICKSVTIGRNAIVGASSVITKDIPDNEVWAGNPARFIRKRENIENN